MTGSEARCRFCGCPEVDGICQNHGCGNNAPKPGKTKHPSGEVLEVAGEIYRVMAPCCERIVIAGSLRRLKAEAGDAEILFIPKQGNDGLFGDLPFNLTNRVIDGMLASGTLRKRASSADRTAWGPLNKLAVHCKSGIGVDLFATTHENWWNSLVVRTGPAAFNEEIGRRAIVMGWRFHAYGSGFSRGDEYHHTTSEREVIEFTGLPYAEPWGRK